MPDNLVEMDELREFCRRMLLDPALADEAAADVATLNPTDRLATLAAARRACRDRAGRMPSPATGPVRAGAGGALPESAAASAQSAERPNLDAAVAAELAAASGQLAERHRETLALRELLGLSYQEIAAVIGVEPMAVGPLIARARLRLRLALRGAVAAEAPCDARDRALRMLARRQDHEPMEPEDEDWLLDHLGTCAGCARDHAAMLEASVCYRAWPSGPSDAAGAAPVLTAT